MRDSMIFYRSFYEAIKDLNFEQQGIIFNAIFDYGLNFKEPKLEGICKTIWTLIKPQLDANIKKFKNGKQPKQKQKESKTEANNKQIISKTEANVNDNVNDNVNANEKVNVNVNVNDNENFDFSKLKNTMWADEFRKKKGIHSVEKFNTIFDNFIDNIKLKGQHLDYKDPEKEVKNHFVNWYDKQPTQPTTIATYKRNQVIK